MAADVAGIVLAAGRSTRMGQAKPLLAVNGDSFLSRAVGALRGGCGDVVVVTAGDPASATIVAAAGALLVENPDPDSEQLDSLRLALGRLAERARAAAVLPVDHPLVRPETVAALVARWRAHPHRIVRPVHDGRPGHPTIFPRSVWPALGGELPRGARSVVEDPAHATDDVAVDDPGVIADIDTPEAYARWIGAP